MKTGLVIVSFCMILLLSLCTPRVLCQHEMFNNNKHIVNEYIQSDAFDINKPYVFSVFLANYYPGTDSYPILDFSIAWVGKNEPFYITVFGRQIKIKNGRRIGKHPYLFERILHVQMARTALEPYAQRLVNENKFILGTPEGEKTFAPVGGFIFKRPYKIFLCNCEPIETIRDVSDKPDTWRGELTVGDEIPEEWLNFYLQMERELEPEDKVVAQPDSFFRYRDIFLRKDGTIPPWTYPEINSEGPKP